MNGYFEYNGVRIRNDYDVDDNTIYSYYLRFRKLAERTVSIEPYGIFEFVVELEDGTRLIYDQELDQIYKLYTRDIDISEEEFKREFARRLRRRLAIKFMDQKDLAEQIGISTAQISRYLSGKSMPTFFVMDKLARALDCSIDDFMY